jgi:hypothetical protein
MSEVRFREQPDARVAPQARPKPLTRREGIFKWKYALSDPTDLVHAAGQEGWAGASPRIADVCLTIENAIGSVSEGFIQFFAEKERENDAQVAAFAARLERLEAANKSLQRANAELQDEVTDLAHQVQRQKAIRGGTDGQSLPTALVRRKVRAPAKRKRAAASATEGAA